MSSADQDKKPVVTTSAASISSDATSTTQVPASSSSNKPPPDVAMKWGITPSKAEEAPPRPEESYSPEEQAERAKLRAKGINPDLKAEMDAKVYGNGKGGFWNKVAGTAIGGGWIK